MSSTSSPLLRWPATSPYQYVDTSPRFLPVDLSRCDARVPNGDTAPHFTTIAQFVSMLGADITHVFAAVPAICDQQGPTGREMFAIDGVKLPSHASDPGLRERGPPCISWARDSPARPLNSSRPCR